MVLWLQEEEKEDTESLEVRTKFRVAGVPSEYVKLVLAMEEKRREKREGENKKRDRNKMKKEKLRVQKESLQLTTKSLYLFLQTNPSNNFLTK